MDAFGYRVIPQLGWLRTAAERAFRPYWPVRIASGRCSTGTELRIGLLRSAQIP